MKALEYLDQAKARSGIPSDYQLAKALKVPPQTVSMWRTGARRPDALACFRLADLAGVDPALVVADIELERAQRVGRADEVSAWEQLATRLSGAAAAVLSSVILSGLALPGKAYAVSALDRASEGDRVKIVAVSGQGGAPSRTTTSRRLQVA